MKHYLYKYEANWADEMDVSGFMILKETEKDMALAKIKRNFRNGGTVSIGSNEEIEYSNFDEVMNDISIEEISKENYDTINRLFGGSFGETGPCDNFIDVDYEDIDDESDEDDEQDKYEADYIYNADKIIKFIKEEYNLEENDPRDDMYSSFSWKPTPKTQIQILIPSYEGAQNGEEMELNLKLNGRELDVEFFDVEDTSDDLGLYDLKKFIKECLKKANKF